MNFKGNNSLIPDSVKMHTRCLALISSLSVGDQKGRGSNFYTRPNCAELSWYLQMKEMKLFQSSQEERSLKHGQFLNVNIYRATFISPWSGRPLELSRINF